MTSTELTLKLFQELQLEFPHIQMELRREHRDVDIALDIPKQAGVTFNLFLYLDGDELHLSVDEVFWLEWFPCTRPNILSDYSAAARGLLQGSYRLLSYERFGRTEKTLLQRLSQKGWKTVGRYYKYPYVLFLPSFFHKRVLRNE
jgi:hypothetical protein